MRLICGSCGSEYDTGKAHVCSRSCPAGCASLVIHYHVAFSRRYRYVPKDDDVGWRVFCEVWDHGKSCWVEGNNFEVVSK